MGNSVQGLTKVQVDDTPAFPSSTRWVTWSQKEITLVRQDLPFMNLCWLGLIPWLSFTCPVGALGMNDSRHRGQADRPVVPGILLPTLLVDGCPGCPPRRTVGERRHGAGVLLWQRGEPRPRSTAWQRRRCWVAGAFWLRGHQGSFHLHQLAAAVAGRQYSKEEAQRIFNLLFISVLFIPALLTINFGAGIKLISCLARAGAQLHPPAMAAEHSEQN